jgi:hypothetical protein
VIAATGPFYYFNSYLRGRHHKIYTLAKQGRRAPLGEVVAGENRIKRRRMAPIASDMAP